MYGGKDMVEVMTDKQFDKIIKMISMILDGCKDLDCLLYTYDAADEEVCV